MGKRRWLRKHLECAPSHPATLAPSAPLIRGTCYCSTASRSPLRQLVPPTSNLASSPADPRLRRSDLCPVEDCLLLLLHGLSFICLLPCQQARPSTFSPSRRLFFSLFFLLCPSSVQKSGLYCLFAYALDLGLGYGYTPVSCDVLCCL